MIHVKILGNKARLRYPLRRVVEAAWASLGPERGQAGLTVTEVSDLDEILRYTPVLVAPGLVINEKLVYDLWIPSREQVVGWLREALRSA